MQMCSHTCVFVHTCLCVDKYVKECHREHGGWKSIPIRVPIKSDYEWLPSVGERWPALRCHWINDINKCFLFLTHHNQFIFFFLLPLRSQHELNMSFNDFWLNTRLGVKPKHSFLFPAHVVLSLLFYLWPFSSQNAVLHSGVWHTQKDISTYLRAPGPKGKRNLHRDFSTHATAGGEHLWS